MCCDGTVFADVRLSPQDQSRISNTSKLPACLQKAVPAKLRQPCPAWIERKCAIYKSRPEHCRNFNCALLQKAIAGGVSYQTALKTIQACLRKAAKVRKLLRALGDQDEKLSIMNRFWRTMRKYESQECDAEARHLLAELTQAAHALNRALGQHIYP
jgi:Fe-S-cluster containining protein